METRELVDGALADPASGFAAIYDAYADRIHDYCNSILRSADDAADAAQDTFVLAYQRLGQLRDPEKLTAWLYAIARSRCLRRIDGRKRQQPVDDMELLTPADEDAPAGLETQEARELVWAAAAGLADDDRAVLDAHLRHGLTGPELADVLGVPTPKANQMLHRMKERLERTVGSIVVLRAGRKDCDELASIAGDGELTPLIRKRVARHIDKCDICGSTRKRLTPQLAYAAIPLVPAPAALRGQVLEQTGSVAAPTGTDATLVDRTSLDDSQWRSDGFPDTPPRPDAGGAVANGNRGGLACGLGAAAAVAVALFVGVGIGRLFSDDDPASTEVAADAPTTTETTVLDPTTSTDSVPGPTPGPPPTSGTDPTTPTAPPDTEPEVDPDTMAPTLAPLDRTCGSTTTIRATVLDDIDEDPMADLQLDWQFNAGSPVPMERIGTTNTYEGEATGIGEGTTTFTVSGTITDASGNTATPEASIDCTFID